MIVFVIDVMYNIRKMVHCRRLHVLQVHVASESVTSNIVIVTVYYQQVEVICIKRQHVDLFQRRSIRSICQRQKTKPRHTAAPRACCPACRRRSGSPWWPPRPSPSTNQPPRSSQPQRLPPPPHPLPLRLRLPLPLTLTLALMPRPAACPQSTTGQPRCQSARSVTSASFAA